MTFPVIVIAGPTCTGKSATAVALAGMIGGEVISADSVQVYRGMDIGSAKISSAEMGDIPHHLIDIADPSEPLNVIAFRDLALAAVEDIRSRGNVPIITGGTGFYIDSLLFESPDFEPGTDPELREKLRKRAGNGELDAMYRELSELDPDYASSVHPHNVARITRALEYCITTGSRYSDYALGTSSRPVRFPFRCFVLDDDRSELYSRIDSRVDSMIDRGFANEVRLLVKKGLTGDSVPMQAVGYRQMYDHVSGLCSLDETADDIKRSTRHVAKRQLTWFRHVSYSEWLDISGFGRDPSRVADEIRSRL